VPLPDLRWRSPESRAKYAAISVWNVHETLTLDGHEVDFGHDLGINARCTDTR